MKRRPIASPQPSQRQTVSGMVKDVDREIAEKFAECYNNDGIQSLIKILETKIQSAKNRVHTCTDWAMFLEKRAEIETMENILRTMKEIHTLYKK